MKIKETFSGARRSRPLHGMSRFRLEVSAEGEWNSSSSYLVERERENKDDWVLFSSSISRFDDDDVGEYYLRAFCISNSPPVSRAYF
jgi:hypothetical protein